MPFPGWAAELRLLPRLTCLIEGTWILPAGSVSTYWQWCHLSALAVISCLIDFCLVILPASSSSQAPLLGISLPSPYWLIDSPIHLLQGGWQAGIWLFFLQFYCLKDGCLKPLVFCPDSQCANRCSSLNLGVRQILFFLQVMESLTNLHLHVLRSKRKLLFDLLTAWDCFPRFCLWELSDCWTNTTLVFPQVSKQSQIAAGLWTDSTWLCTISKPCQRSFDKILWYWGKEKY